MHPLLDALDPEQRAVAEALRGPVRVLAGAGTGKTRAITHRIAFGVATGVYQPTEVLAVTFTAKAAGEMRERLRRLGAGGVQARTFHAAALRQLRYFWPHVHGRELPTLTQSKIGMLATAASRQRIKAEPAVLRDLAAEVEWAKVSNVTPDDYPALAQARGRAVGGLDPAQVGRVFGGYEEVKRSQGRMDMEDVLLLAAALLADDERVAAQVRRQYKFFTVDEFQDVSPLQSALLNLWLGGRDEICVVGDPAQTIYSFAGATPTYLHDFTKTYPGAISIDLVRNYRSSPEIVESANRVLRGARSQHRGVELVSQQPAGAQPTFAGYPDEPTEAAEVARALAGLHASGVPWSQMAVLFRINAQSEAFEDACAAVGVPYVVRGAARFFERPEVKQALTLLRGTARAGDLADDPLDDVRGTLAGMGWVAEPPQARGEARNRWESWQALVSQAEDFFTNGAGATLADLVADWERRAQEQHAPVADGVTLATFHAAKGLEWDAVFCCGVHEGAMPISYAEGTDAIEEERRLLYVGITRARAILSVSWAAARTPGGRGNRKPSRFLDPFTEVTRQSRVVAAEQRSKRKLARCKSCGVPLDSPSERKTGRCHNCPIPYDEALFEQLKAWRRERAGADKVPAYVVFTDATLELIAESRPDNESALLRINGIGRGKVDKYAEELLAVLKTSG